MAVIFSTMSNFRSTKIALGAGCFLSFIRSALASGDETEEAAAATAAAVPTVPPIKTAGAPFQFTRTDSLERFDFYDPDTPKSDELTRLHSLNGGDGHFAPSFKTYLRDLGFDLQDSLKMPAPDATPTAAASERASPRETPPPLATQSGTSSDPSFSDNDSTGPGTGGRREESPRTSPRNTKPKSPREEDFRRREEDIRRREQHLAAKKRLLQRMQEMNNFVDFDYNRAANLVRIQIELFEAQNKQVWYAHFILPWIKSVDKSLCQAFWNYYGCRCRREFEHKVLKVALNLIASRKRLKVPDWTDRELENFQRLEPKDQKWYLIQHNCSDYDELKKLMDVAKDFDTNAEGS